MRLGGGLAYKLTREWLSVLPCIPPGAGARHWGEGAVGNPPSQNSHDSSSRTAACSSVVHLRVHASSSSNLPCTGWGTSSGASAHRLTPRPPGNLVNELSQPARGVGAKVEGGGGGRYALSPL